MTPRQLFSKPHPLRVAPLVAKATRPLFSPNLFVEDQAVTLIQSIIPVFEISQQVSTIYTVPGAPDKTVATPTQSLFIPDGSNGHIISWGFADATGVLSASDSCGESLHPCPSSTSLREEQLAPNLALREHALRVRQRGVLRGPANVRHRLNRVRPFLLEH